MRRALVVGIDYYQHLSPLYGCANDANAVARRLERHEDGRPNFSVQVKTATDRRSALSRGDLKDLVAELLAGTPDISLLYFAGHGHVEATGGYLCASDCERGDDGLALGELLTLVNKSRAQSKLVVLDSCHSGVAGNPPASHATELTTGTTILTASTAEQYASEANGSGVFTTLFVDALDGSAANLLGDITPGSVYAHIDQSLGAWRQRPVFKANVERFVSLRTVAPPIPTSNLRRLTSLFPTAKHVFPLDPSFEPELRGRPEGAPPPDPTNTERFAVLQSFNRVGLLTPHGAPHMWHAAIESKGCKLTPLGEHYHRLVADGLI